MRAETSHHHAETLVQIGKNHLPVRTQGTGPPLLLLNGIGGHVDTWEPLVRQLAGGRTLVMFDAPGTGSSAQLRRPSRMAGLAELVVAVLDGLRLGQVDVLGYSWGGALAQQVARDAGDRIRRLVLVATTPGVGGMPPRASAALASMGLGRLVTPLGSLTTAASVYGGDYRHGSRMGGTALRSWTDHPPSAVGYVQQLLAIAGWSSLPWLRRLDHRTLIISGDDDPLVPVFNARLLSALIRYSDLRVVPGAGHLWLLDHAPESAAAIEEFLARP